MSAAPRDRFSRKATGVPAFVILSAGVAAIPLAVRRKLLQPRRLSFTSRHKLSFRSPGACVRGFDVRETRRRLRCYFSPSAPQRTATELALVSAVLGAGNGLSAGISSTLAADFAPPAPATGAFLGVWRVITDGGSMLGPVLGGWLKQRFGLPRAAVIVGGLGLLGALWLTLVVRQPTILPRISPRRPSPPRCGSLLRREKRRR